MTSYNVSKIFIIGGTGAQGIPIIKSLVSDKKYSVRVLTRDLKSKRAQDLVALGNVELVEGSFADEATLKAGYEGCDGAFVNIDGFNTGEALEVYWAIRCYEIALQSNIKFFVYGNLDFVSRKTGYDPRFRAGHYDGKGRIGEWILFQNKFEKNRERMGAALFTTGPYIEMALSSGTLLTPKIEDGTVTWRVPVGEGNVNFVALDDCGVYVRWLFDNPARSNGLDLEVAIAPIPLKEFAAAFSRVTGKPAQYIDQTLEDHWSSGSWAGHGHLPAGYNAIPGSLSIKDNFTAFWNIWKYNVLDRDYKLLDEIHPKRIKSAEEFFRREEEKGGKGSLWNRVQGGNLAPILKISEDGRSGKL